MQRELHTWKDVANYLGVSVRTAQLWESQRGLPVRRLPGEKARILASADELDEWKRGNHPHAASPAVTIPWPLALAAGIAIGAAATWFATRPARFHHFTVANGVLQAFDSSGAPTWSRQIAGRNTIPGDYWLANAEQVDLDGDGDPEIVAIDRTGRGSHSVVCFDSRGSKLWSRQLGRAIRTAKDYDPPFHSRGLQVLYGFPDNKPRILATAFHHTFHPSQVLLLDASGAVQADFWHSGHLAAFSLFDWNADGRPELLAGGVNQAARLAELLILDPTRMTGAATAGTAEFQIVGMPTGVEMARVQFPRFPATGSQSPYSFVSEIHAKSGSVLVGVNETRELASISPSIYFEIDRGRRVLAVSPSDWYRQLHNSLSSAGQFAGPITPDELKAALPLSWFSPN